MGDRGRQLAHRRDAFSVRELQLRLSVSLRAFASFCLRALRSVNQHEATTLVTASSMLPAISTGTRLPSFLVYSFRTVRTDRHFLLFDPCVIPVAPVGRR